MGLGSFWIRLKCARLLVSAKEYVAAANHEAARRDVERIFHLCATGGLDVPLRAEIMRALVIWNLGDYAATAFWVRRAADKIAKRMEAEKRPEKLNEIHYLRAYCWTLLYYSETLGGEVPWEIFADLVPAFYVDVSALSRTTREMFPIDEQVFALTRA